MQIEHALDIRRLKLRLMLGCFLVALLVSFIFIYSSFKLARDLGQDLEKQALRNEVSAIKNYIEYIYSARYSRSGINEFCDQLSPISQKDPNLSIVLTYENKIICTDNVGRMLVPQFKNSNHEEIVKTNTLEYHSDVYFYNLISFQNNTLMLYVFRKSYSKNKTQELVSKRISIVSFITFWVSIWLAIIVSTSVSKRVEISNKKLTHLATHDDLTGAFNRLYLTKKIRNFINKDDSNRKGAILLIDLNGFKEINDNLGHESGDIVLCTISQRIKRKCGSNSTVARLGGDEFVVWLEKLEENSVLGIASELSGACAKPININKEIVAVGVSIGCAYYPKHGDKPKILLKHADEAMYRAKSLRQNIVTYSPDSKHSSHYKLKLRSQIKNAILDERFILYYQPQINLNDGKLVGAEALVRWQHSEEGLLYPDTFIDLVEQTELVHKFGYYILDKAISQAADWHRNGVDIKVAVNLSPYNMLDLDLPSRVQSLLNLHGLPVNLLEIELTESATMVALETIEDMFLKLRRLGIGIAIDDFGTGMSSFAYLKKLNVDTVKIDREFVSDLDTFDQNRLVVSGIVSLCKKMKKHVVAEGVECELHEQLLKEMGCDFAQGYYYSKPIPAASFLSFVNASTLENTAESSIRSGQI